MRDRRLFKFPFTEEEIPGHEQNKTFLQTIINNNTFQSMPNRFIFLGPKGVGKVALAVNFLSKIKIPDKANFFVYPDKYDIAFTERLYDYNLIITDGLRGYESYRAECGNVLEEYSSVFVHCIDKLDKLPLSIVHKSLVFHFSYPTYSEIVTTITQVLTSYEVPFDLSIVKDLVQINSTNIYQLYASIDALLQVSHSGLTEAEYDQFIYIDDLFRQIVSFIHSFDSRQLNTNVDLLLHRFSSISTLIRSWIGFEMRLLEGSIPNMSYIVSTDEAVLNRLSILWALSDKLTLLDDLPSAIKLACTLMAGKANQKFLSNEEVLALLMS